MANSAQLYIAPAESMSVGGLAGVELSLSETSDASLHCKIQALDPFNDKFGDEMIHLKMSYLPAFGIPIRKLKLRHPSGVTGFDSIDISKKIIDVVFDTANLATELPETLLAFTDGVNKEGDLMQFFGRRGKVPFMVTYHQPDVRLKTYLVNNKFPGTDAAASLRTLIRSLNFCGAALVWSWADGLNPVLLSVRSKEIISALAKRAEAAVFEVLEVNSEQELPAW